MEWEFDEITVLIVPPPRFPPAETPARREERHVYRHSNSLQTQDEPFSIHEMLKCIHLIRHMNNNNTRIDGFRHGAVISLGLQGHDG